MSNSNYHLCPACGGVVFGDTSDENSTVSRLTTVEPDTLPDTDLLEKYDW